MRHKGLCHWSSSEPPWNDTNQFHLQETCFWPMDTHAWLCWSTMPQQLQSKNPCEPWPWPWAWAAHRLSPSLSLHARWDHIKTWNPLMGERGIQFSYCTIHFIPSCRIKFIPFWSVVCVYKSFKLICFRCCGNRVANWIPKCLSRFHTHDKEPEHPLVGVRTEAERWWEQNENDAVTNCLLHPRTMPLWCAKQRRRRPPLKGMVHEWLPGLICRSPCIFWPWRSEVSLFSSCLICWLCQGQGLTLFILLAVSKHFSHRSFLIDS